MIRVTRKYRFSASHRLHSAGLSANENAELYGKCNHPYGHGHNYEIEVSARGPVEDRSGRVLDPRILNRLVEEQVVQPFNCKNLNVDSAAFEDVVPTTENLAREIYRRLAVKWTSVFPGPWPVLEKIRIAETPRNIFEVSEYGKS
ncbi:MAG: 6-carboxytetrahydropterin synthase [Acidobacteriia bacterium]|nr:6-carboxytetrahydropterin synthase [Terriglobia bacterium]